MTKVTGTSTLTIPRGQAPRQIASAVAVMALSAINGETTLRTAMAAKEASC
jgi:hypothetical protein